MSSHDPDFQRADFAALAAKWSLTRAQCYQDARGKLGVLELPLTLPFEAQRVFYVFDLPAHVRRGGHAHKTLHQCMVCLTGALDVTLDDGSRQQTFRLDDPTKALHIPPLTWASQDNIESGTTYFVLASETFDEADYLRNYDDFLRTVAR